MNLQQAQHLSRPRSCSIGALSCGPSRPSLRWPRPPQQRQAVSRAKLQEDCRHPHQSNVEQFVDAASAQSWSDFSVRVALERLYQVNGHLFTLLEPSSSGPLAATPNLPAYLAVSLEEKPSTYKERSPDFYANVGDAIRTLRDDIPLLFERDLNYEIYTPDIVFRDPRNCFKGMQNYQLIFWSLRFHGRIFFSKLYVEVKRIWQPEDSVIKMRWTVHGIPRVPWEAEGIFDGISTYKLDNHGRIIEHQVDNVVLRDPPMQRVSPLLAGLNLVPMPAQQPYPGAFCRATQEAASQQASRLASSGPPSAASDALLAYWRRFSWVRMYVALLATMQVVAGGSSGAPEPVLEA